MKPRRWACFEGPGPGFGRPSPRGASNEAARPRWPGLAALLSALALSVAAGSAPAATVEPRDVQVIVSADARPPRDDDPRWAGAATPDSRHADVAWYRVTMTLPRAADGATWMLYLPYFYGGGRVWLNGEPMAAVLENSAELRVRWERPLLLPLPQGLLRDGVNVLHLRVASAHQPAGIKLPRLVLGPQQELQPMFDLRLFVTRTVPLVTVVTGAVVGTFVLWIWWRRRQEVAYGLFGLAALLWALRTTTFVFDALPAAWWAPWRALYHGATGGFIAVLALFALSLAGWYRRGLALALLGYVLVGPLALLVGGAAADDAVGRWWVLGLVPIGLTVAMVSAANAWRQRSAGTVAIALAVAAAVLAGVHDYGVAWSAPWIEALLPSWAGHRIFLLHQAANLLLIVMGALLTARFVGSLHQVEQANRTLEARVAERERQIAASYAHIATLEREQARHDERQRIMQDLHDGLGSQLFTTMMRAERGALDAPAAAQALRGAIDEMRLAIDTLAAEEPDGRTALANFRYRWDERLREAGLEVQWAFELPDDRPLALTPHAVLQLLRIAQEALTNVVKHARARRVEVALTAVAGGLRLRVADDGIGLSGQGAAAGSAGRGLAGMRARATRLGGELAVTSRERGTTVELELPAAR